MSCGFFLYAIQSHVLVMLLLFVVCFENLSVDCVNKNPFACAEFWVKKSSSRQCSHYSHIEAEPEEIGDEGCTSFSALCESKKKN